MAESIGKLNVLIVEDDKGISDFIIPELEHEGFKTRLAETGRQALEMFEAEEPPHSPERAPVLFVGVQHDGCVTVHGITSEI